MNDASGFTAFVLRHYPRLGDSRDFSPGDWEEMRRNAPETAALQSVQRAAIDKIPEWRQFLSSLKSSLPLCTIRDETLLEFDACYGVLVGLPNAEGALIDKIVLAYASLLAPVYLLYELHQQHTAEGAETLARLDEPSDEARPVFEIIERELAARFGLERLDPAIAATPVPDICMDNLGLGEVTLADALFTEHRW
ncbi:MAG: hypothetical protein OEY28_03500 [Nitrospira sp.]|nr:hypothetical protein [Nitrospira sp.]